MRGLELIKVEGLGNDFLLLDRRDVSVEAIEAEVTKGKAETDDRKGTKRRGRMENHILEIMTLFGTESSVSAKELIDKAKGLLMEQKNIGEDAAYKLMRKLAMEQNKRIGEVAQDILTYAKALKP